MGKEEHASFFQHVNQAKKDFDAGASDSAPSSPELGSSSSRASIASIPTPVSPIGSSSVADSFVFAFDIDGVLVRGGQAIEEAVQAMKVLDGENEFGIKV